MSHEHAVKQFLVTEFLPDMGPEDLDPTLDLVAGGVVDSLGLLKLLVWLEDRFGILADDVDLDPELFRTVEAIDAFIAQHTTGADAVAGPER